MHIHSILQSRILESVVFPLSRGSSWPREDPRSPSSKWILYQLNHKGSPRTLNWVACPFSSRSSQPRNQTGVSCIAGRFFTNWAIREASRLCIKKKRSLCQQGLYGQSYCFSSSHLWIWELDRKEGWALRIDAFELWFRRRLLRVPWTARRSNLSILKKSTPIIHWKDWCWC